MFDTVSGTAVVRDRKLPVFPSSAHEDKPITPDWDGSTSKYIPAMSYTDGKPAPNLPRRGVQKTVHSLEDGMNMSKGGLIDASSHKPNSNSGNAVDVLRYRGSGRINANGY